MTIKVDKARDYSVFNRLKGNRKTSKAHVKRIKEAFADDPEAIKYNPILVNEDMEIVDGQHRFEAIKEMGLPVYYLKHPNLTLETVQKLNSSSKNWSPTDFAKSYAELGNPHYIEYLEFQKKFPGYGVKVLAYYLSDGVDNTILFKRGHFKVKNLEKATKKMEMFEELAEVADQRGKGFAIAFYRTSESPNYKHKHLLKRMESWCKKNGKVQNLSNTIDNLRFFEERYNYRLAEHKHIRAY